MLIPATGSDLSGTSGRIAYLASVNSTRRYLEIGVYGTLKPLKGRGLGNAARALSRLFHGGNR